MRSAFLALLVSLAACRAPVEHLSLETDAAPRAVQGELREPDPVASPEHPPEAVSSEVVSSALEDTSETHADTWGSEWRRFAREERRWSAHVSFPVWIGYSSFDLGSDPPLENLTTLSFVPTVDFVRTINENWLWAPYIGFGGGWLIDSDLGIAILTSGVRAEWVHHVDDRTAVRFVPGIRYDANLTREDNLLGDWGRLEVAVELRRAFGTDDDSFAPGLYAQSFWFWDDIELEIIGITPETTEGQTEVGLSFGFREPLEVFGVGLPRMFVGYRFGDGIDTFAIRFGDL